MVKVIRDREYRRYVLEKKLYYRLEKLTYFTYSFYRFKGINGYTISKPIVSDYIGSDSYKIFKTISTTKFDSRDKTKYSPNGMYGRSSYDRSRKMKNTREYDKCEFFKLLKEYGLK